MTEDPDAPSGLARLYRGRFQETQARTGRWLRREASELRPERRSFRRDVVAGLPGAISRVPDGMAASVLAGVNPAHGLYASFAGPTVGGLTSSTRLMVVTTTSAAALAAGSALAAYDEAERSDAILLLTLLVGGLMLLAAVLRLSRYIRFVSYSVMLGFLTGVAVNMVLGQLADLVGVDPEGSVAVAKAWYVVTHLGEVNGASALAGAAALTILVCLGPTRLAVVSSLLALAVPTAVVMLADATSVARVDDSGAIPHGVPMPAVPEFDLLSPALLGGAAAVAALALVQGAGVAEAAPNPDGSRSSMRRDFTAQGLANIASSAFGGQPVGGSVGQTALNLTTGARSRWASVCSGLWMLAILLLFSGLVGQVAMPTLAAVLVYAGIGAIKPPELIAVARAGRIPAIAMTATLISVLVLPVAEAVAVGVIASLALQLRQEQLDLRLVRLERNADGRVTEAEVPAMVRAGDVVVIDAYGSLFYSGARTLQRRLPQPDPDSPADRAGPVVVLRLRGRTTLGATFLKVIGDYARSLEARGGRLFLSGVDPELVRGWQADGTLVRLAGVTVLAATPVLGESTDAAVAAARGLEAHPVVSSVLGDGEQLDDVDPE
ncbi:MAG TPA: SulP family inorganic anion transporter [Nocardioides bacterium]|uniref:SulP family inorganic anion transporter n=1 Tax=uncultured Nocardioides sp. TaxID=198441 RepID=UPI000EE8BD7F|nr:SulP family inorganic anion transporter [uncultured Nocardioides sp.]HCB02886.1 SulP family inorganic anion transporter [Nocardioides sp.]